MPSSTKTRQTVLQVDGLVVTVMRDSRGSLSSVQVMLPRSNGATARPASRTSADGAQPNGAEGHDMRLASVERFWREWARTGGALHRLFQPCSSAQLHQVYALWCESQAIEAPVAQDVLSMVLRRKPGITIDRGSFRRKDATKRQLRCVYVDGQHAPPDHYRGTKIDWLTACVERFSDQVLQLQKSGVLPHATRDKTPARRRPVDSPGSKRKIG